MTLENEKRLLLLMSSYILETDVTKNRVLDYIESKNWVNFVSRDLETKQNRDELVWRNDFAFVRKHLALEGLYVSGVRNDWSITTKGIFELKSLCKQAASEESFKKASIFAKQSAVHLLKELEK